MRSKIIKDNEQIITKVEAELKSVYDGNDSFNKTFDGEQSIEINSKILDENGNSYSYEFTPSEVLFWIERLSYFNELENHQNEEILQKHKDLLAFLHDEKFDQSTVFEGLIDAIRRKRIAPFIGAGLSKPFMFPLWSEALDEINNSVQSQDEQLEDVEKLINSKQYLDAAQKLYEYDKQQFNYYIKKKFELTEEKRKQIIKNGIPRLITKITSGAVITTNYDKVIETAFETENKSFHGFMHGVQQKNQFVRKLIKGDRCILKLHGDVEYEDTYIFSKEQYENAYNDVDTNRFDFKKPLPKTLRQIYISHSLLFLGCSLEQDKTLDLFKHINEEGQFEIPEHFAILENKEPKNGRWRTATENRLLKLNIRPIWYNKGEYKRIEEMLSLAIDVVDKKVEFKPLKS